MKNFPLASSRLTFFLLFFSVALLMGSCTCVSCDDDDGGGGNTMSNENEVFEATEVETVERIIALHTTQDELQVFTKSEFLRVEMGTDRVVQIRNFLPQFEALGQPATNDLIFARGLRDTRDGSDEIEFQLVLNQGEVRRFSIDSLTSSLLAIEDDGAQIGAFNELGTIYIQPVIQRDERRLGMLIFSIETDQTFFEIEDISFVGLVDFPTVREAPRVVSSIRYIDDHFYIATKFGAYRLSETGVLETLVPNPTDIRDIFKFDDKFYATQVSLAPMFTSETGESWESSGIVTDLRLVDVFDQQLVSQELEGWQYQLTNQLTEVTEPLMLNESFGNVTNDQFFGIEKFGSSFYLGFENVLYKTVSLRTRP